MWFINASFPPATPAHEAVTRECNEVEMALVAEPLSIDHYEGRSLLLGPLGSWETDGKVGE